MQQVQIVMNSPTPIVPSPSIDKAFSLVIQEKRQRCLGFTVAPLVESTTLAIKNQGFNQGNSFPGNNSKNIKGNNAKGRHVCSHCGSLVILWRNATN